MSNKSFFMFAKEASDVTNGQIDIDNLNASGKFRIHDFWNMQPVSSVHILSDTYIFKYCIKWEKAYAEQPESDLIFPEQDLLYSLTSIYFTFINTIMPLLHRPSFERSMREGQYLVDKKFGKVVLAICAVASRYSTDTRVRYPDDMSGTSSGWKYFSQIQLISSSTLVNKFSLYDLQHYCVSDLSTLLNMAYNGR